MRKSWLAARPFSGTYGVAGVVLVKLNVELNWIVAFEDWTTRTIRMSGGIVVLELGATMKIAFDSAVKERYWTVVPLIQFRTRVTDELE